jgi:hypothetical protein
MLTMHPYQMGQRLANTVIHPGSSPRAPPITGKLRSTLQALRITGKPKPVPKAYQRLCLSMTQMIMIKIQRVKFPPSSQSLRAIFTDSCVRTTHHRIFTSRHLGHSNSHPRYRIHAPHTHCTQHGTRLYITPSQIHLCGNKRLWSRTVPRPQTQKMK